MAKDLKSLKIGKPKAPAPAVEADDAPPPVPETPVESDALPAGPVELPDGDDAADAPAEFAPGASSDVPPAPAAEPDPEPPTKRKRTRPNRYRVQFTGCPPFVCEAADGDDAAAKCKAAYGVLSSQRSPTIEETDLPLTDL
jgi:hypothetical protein